MKTYLLLGALIVCALASCGDDDDKDGKFEHNHENVHTPNGIHDGSQDKLVPGSRDQGNRDVKHEP
jgi:hypothetical protein